MTEAAAAPDDAGVVSAELLLDGAPLGAADLEEPYELIWPTVSMSRTVLRIARVAATE